MAVKRLWNLSAISGDLVQKPIDERRNMWLVDRKKLAGPFGGRSARGQASLTGCQPVTIFGLWRGHIGRNIDTRQAFGGSASFARLGYAQQADKHSFADEEHPRDRDCRLQVGRSLRPARSSEALYLHPRPKKINPPRRLTDRRGHRDPHPKRPTEVPDHGKRKQSSKLGCPRKDCRSDS